MTRPNASSVPGSRSMASTWVGTKTASGWLIALDAGTEAGAWRGDLPHASMAARAKTVLIWRVNLARVTVRPRLLENHRPGIDLHVDHWTRQNSGDHVGSGSAACRS